jgi:hypothetical protein
MTNNLEERQIDPFKGDLTYIEHICDEKRLIPSVQDARIYFDPMYNVWFWLFRDPISLQYCRSIIRYCPYCGKNDKRMKGD